MDYPTILFIRGAGARHAIASQIGFLFYEQTFFDRFSVLTLMFVSFNPEFWWNDLLSLVDLAQSFAVVGIHHTKLEFRHARELISGFLNLRSVKAWNLDKNAIGADRTDNRFASAKIIYALPNYLDGLLKHSFRDWLVARHKSDQK